MDLPGVSFSPFNQGPNQAPPGQQSAPVQDAIKILSFRMPTTVGASAPAAAPLMGGAGGQMGAGASMQSGLMQELLRRLFQGQGVQTPPGEAQPAAAGLPPMPQGGGMGASLPGLSVPLGSPQTTTFAQPQGSPFQPPSVAPNFPTPNDGIFDRPTPSWTFDQGAGGAAGESASSVPALPGLSNKTDWTGRFNE